MNISPTRLRRRFTIELPAADRLHLSSRFLPHVSLVLVLAILAWVGMLQMSTPEVVPASAPAAEFSAERAMQHLRVITAEPRPIGSAGNGATREYLVQQAQALGFEVEVQTASVVARSEGTGGFGAGTVNNVIVRVPGSNSTGTIAIDAHYDGASTGPAASDAGAGVVAALETLRALAAGSPLQNDLIVLFADGEEGGMLGAAAFNEQHPLADDVQLAINFEAQGSGGPAILYATSEESGWLVEQFLDVVPNAAGYSILPEITRLVPGARLDCDLGEFTEEGSHGLGFVYAADTPAYHTARDNVDEIDVGSIQQKGDYTLALVNHFGNTDLSNMPRTSERIFFSVLPGVALHYSFTWIIPLAALVTLLVGALAFNGLRRGEMSRSGLALGTVAFLAGTLATVALASMVWFIIRTLNSDYQVMLIGTYQTIHYIIALTFASIALLTGLYALLRRRMDLLDLATGVLIGGTLVLWFTSIVMPGISYIVVWPLLFAVLPVGWTLLAGERAQNVWLRVAVLSLAALPVFLLLPGTLYQVIGLVNRFEGITGMPLLGVTMLFVAPLIALFLLHIDLLEDAVGGRRWVLPAMAGIVAVAMIGWGNVTSGFDAEQPRPNRIAYALDADNGSAQWLSYDQHLDSWTGQFFPNDPPVIKPDSQFYPGLSAYATEAPLVEVAIPTVQVLEDSLDGDLRTLTLNLSTEGAAHMMMTEITADGPIVAAAVNGQSLDVEDDATALDGDLTVAYMNVPEGGWTLSLTVRSTGPLTLVVEDVIDGLPNVPGMVVEPRPADMMSVPGPPLDPTIVTRTFTY